MSEDRYESAARKPAAAARLVQDNFSQIFRCFAARAPLIRIYILNFPPLPKNRSKCLEIKRFSINEYFQFSLYVHRRVFTTISASLIWFYKICSNYAPLSSFRTF